MKKTLHLTPVPFPKPEATLVETGPNGSVRHPMHSGAVMMAVICPRSEYHWMW